jgi:hypothetical protein
MKKHFLSVLLALMTFSVYAQNNELLTLRIEARLDYMQEYVEGNKINNNSGFKGKYLNIRMDGNLAEGLSYSYRQRLNKPNVNATFFDATDWLTLTYKFKNWSVSAGKQVVAIGGYEYDRAPIDLYFCSEYWNNIACYQMGVSGSYTTTAGKDQILFQFCESPFRKNPSNLSNKEMFAYNLMWYGNHGFFSSMYSINFMEYLPGKYINYIALGNRFTFGKFALELDIMNRAMSGSDFLFNDYSIMGELSWKPIDRLNVFVRASYDRNKTVTGDLCVAPGTDLVHAGAGVEFFPLKNYKNLRLHLNCCYTDGDSPSTTVLRPEQTIVDAGLTWYMNLLNIKRKK